MLKQLLTFQIMIGFGEHMTPHCSASDITWHGNDNFCQEKSWTHNFFKIVYKTVLSKGLCARHCALQ